MNSDMEPAAALTAVDGGGAKGATTSVSGAAPRGGPWIIDRWRDLLFFVATPVLLIPLAMLSNSILATTGLYLVVLTFGAIGHQSMCLLRAYGDRELLELYRFRFLFAPVIMLAIGFGFAFSGLSSLAIILLLWGFWHVMSQQYGFLRIYDSKLGSFEVWTIRLDFLMCFFWFGAGVLYSPSRMYQLLDHFYSVGGPLLNSTWVIAAQLVWGLLTAVTTIAFILNYVYQRRQGQTPSLVKLTAMGAGIGLWWYSMINIRDLLLGILLFELFHDIQYVALVRHYGCERSRQGKELGRLSQLLFRRGLISVALFLAILLLYGLPAYLAGITETWLEYDATRGVLFKSVYALVAASTLLHFYYDGFIWQLRNDDVRSTFELPEAKPAAGDAWAISRKIPHVVKCAVFAVPVVWLGFVQYDGGERDEMANVHLVEALPGSWEAHLRFGEELYRQNQLEDAVKQLQEAADLRPTEPEVLCSLGKAEVKLGRFDDALGHFEDALKFAPELVTAHYEYGKLLFGLGKVADGREQLSLAAELAPNDPDIHFDRAVAEIQAQRFESSPAARKRCFTTALESINRAIELDDQNADYYNARGNIYLNTGDLKKAIAEYDRALELDPHLAKAYRNRAQARMSGGETDKAIKDWGEAIKADGQTSRDYVMRGDLFYSLGEYEKARADYAEGLLREETDIEPMMHMIRFLIGCPDESYRNIRQAKLLAETACKWTSFSDPVVLQTLVDTCVAAGDYDEAIRWQEQVVALVPPAIQSQVRERVEQLKQLRAGGSPQAKPDAGETEASGGTVAPSEETSVTKPPQN